MKKSSTVYLICGFLGAGKTTYSKKLAQNTEALHLNPDDVCMQKYKPQEYENNWEACFAKTLDFLWQKVASYITQNQDVIFDMGFWSKSSRQNAIAKIKQMGGEPIIHYIYAPDFILKQRLMTRSGKIAEQNLLNFEIIKKSFEAPEQDENFVTINNFELPAANQMHKMSVQEKYFNLLKSGRKTIELRLFDEKRQKIKIGDIIEFSNAANAKDTFFAQVINLHKAPDFISLCSKISIRKIGFSSQDELLKTLEEFYPSQRQKEFGVIGIEIQI